MFQSERCINLSTNFNIHEFDAQWNSILAHVDVSERAFETHVFIINSSYLNCKFALWWNYLPGDPILRSEIFVMSLPITRL